MNETQISTYHPHLQSAEAGIMVKGYLIETSDHIVAVDSALIESAARELHKQFGSLGKPLAFVLTDGHPHHYNGLTQLTAGMNVDIISTSESYLQELRRTINNLANGRTELSEDDKAKLVEHMNGKFPNTKLEFLLINSADPVAKELARERGQQKVVRGPLMQIRGIHPGMSCEVCNSRAARLVPPPGHGPRANAKRGSKCGDIVIAAGRLD